jgi:hypothetical protein
MPSLTLEEALQNPNIRHYELQEEYYFSVIDILAELRNTDYKTAQNFYHVLKNRMAKNKIKIPTLKQIKARGFDGKFRLTDFVKSSGLHFLSDYIRPNFQKYAYRTLIRKDDEVLNFHPQIIAFFEDHGWQVNHHTKLNSGSEIDILAAITDKTLPQGVFIIECKPRLPRQNFYKAVGQTLCYCAEYGQDAIPVIATMSCEINDYIEHCCHALGINLLSLDLLNNTTIIQNHESYNLVTEKPLLPQKTKR